MQLFVLGESSVSPMKFAVIDCEDAEKWSGHEKIWSTVFGRPGDQWCVSLHREAFGSDAVSEPDSHYPRREVFRAWKGELPFQASEAAQAGENWKGLVITGRCVQPVYCPHCGRDIGTESAVLNPQPLLRFRRVEGMDYQPVRLLEGACSSQRLRRLPLARSKPRTHRSHAGCRRCEQCPRPWWMLRLPGASPRPPAALPRPHPSPR